MALTPDVTQGQGLVASDSLSALLSHLRGDGEVARQPLEAPQALLGQKLTADIDTSTEGGSGILRITARTTDPDEAAAAAAATAKAFQDSIASNKLMIATLVDPASPENTPVQPRPPLLFGVAALLGPVRRRAARARRSSSSGAASTPRRTSRSTRSRRCSGGSTASARCRVAARR